MAPLPKHSGYHPKPWNRIYVADVLDAIDPLICIRCLGRKDQPGVNTICSACQAFFNLKRNAAERFLFFTCLRIFDFSLWVRRKILSDVFILKDDENGTLVEHHLGAPGDKQDLPSLRAVRRPDEEDGEDGEIVLLSTMGSALLQEALLTSRQCDVVLVLLVDIMKSELLQADSPVLKIDEILFSANHKHTSTHWCYRVHVKGGRQFAVAFADRQLGWLHIVRPWREYVLDRFHESDERDALFYMENSDESDNDEVLEDEKVFRSSWRERGVSVRSVGGVLAAHCSKWYPQPHWPLEAVGEWQSQLPPYDMIVDPRPEGWRPAQGLSVEEKEERQKRFECSLVKDNGGVLALWKAWRQETASKGEGAAASTAVAKGTKRKMADVGGAAALVRPEQ